MRCSGGCGGHGTPRFGDRVGAPRRSMLPRVTPWWWPTCASRVAAVYRAPAADANPAAVDRDPLARDPADRVDEHRPLGGLDPLVERLDVVVLGHLDRHLGDDRAGVDARVDHEEGRPGDLDAVLERVARAVHPREGRAQRRVGVEGEEPLEEVRRQQLHEARRHHQVGLEALRRRSPARRPSPRGSRSPTPTA